MNISKIVNRKEETFAEFLKKYWWIEILTFVKIINFSKNNFYNFLITFFIIGIILWILYRLGLQ